MIKRKQSFRYSISGFISGTLCKETDQAVFIRVNAVPVELQNEVYPYYHYYWIPKAALTLYKEENLYFPKRSIFITSRCYTIKEQTKQNLDVYLKTSEEIEPLIKDIHYGRTD